MLELRPGDIILVRGRSFKSRITQFVLRNQWNHAVIYSGSDRTQELTWRGVTHRSFQNEYSNKQIVVIRPIPVDSLIGIFRDKAFRRALDAFQFTTFDWIGYFMRPFGFKDRGLRNKCLCDDYVSRIYLDAHNAYTKSEIPRIDCCDLMRHDYSHLTLYTEHRLQKVYDYRWT